MDFGYDEEAVYQDADIEQARYEEEGRALAADRKRGICHHGGGLGFGHIYTEAEVNDWRKRGHFPDRPTDHTPLVEGQMLCTDCGTIVPDPIAHLQRRINASR